MRSVHFQQPEQKQQVVITAVWARLRYQHRLCWEVWNKRTIVLTTTRRDVDMENILHFFPMTLFHIVVEEVGDYRDTTHQLPMERPITWKSPFLFGPLYIVVLSFQCTSPHLTSPQIDSGLCHPLPLHNSRTVHSTLSSPPLPSSPHGVCASHLPIRPSSVYVYPSVYLSLVLYIDDVKVPAYSRVFFSYAQVVSSSIYIQYMHTTLL